MVGISDAVIHCFVYLVSEEEVQTLHVLKPAILTLVPRDWSDSFTVERHDGLQTRHMCPKTADKTLLFDRDYTMHRTTVHSYS